MWKTIFRERENFVPTEKHIFMLPAQQQQQRSRKIGGRRRRRESEDFSFPFAETPTVHSVFDDPLASNEQESAEKPIFSI